MTDKLKVLDLFSGIGGFSLGLERTGGFETVAFCEIEEFPRKVLKKHWPKVPIYNDVKTLTKDVLDRDGITVDVITGGFPCQDISVAGKQAGITKTSRSGLWSEIARLASEIRPQFIIMENVSNLLRGPREQPGKWFSRVLGDLAERGYNAEWRNIPAWHVGLPHGRERVWLVAYPAEIRHAGFIFKEDRSDRYEACQAGASLLPPYNARMGSAPDCYSLRKGDGLPAFVGCLNALGNAVVPQIPEMIGYAIISSMQDTAE